MSAMDENADIDGGDRKSKEMVVSSPHSGGGSNRTQNKYVAPDFKRRQLIYDSFSKLKASALQAQRSAGNQVAGPKGTLLYAWGAGYHGQLGLSSYRKKCKLVPAWIEFKESVLQVACGGFHTAVLTDTGRVYTWGDGRYGQLGNLARKHNMLATPHLVDRLISMDVHAVQISCGQYHTACISAKGEMYSWGSGKYGQLGHATRLDERYPRKVEVDRAIGPFTQVSCGDRHTAAVTRKRQVVTFGSGQHGQLGHGNGWDYLKPKLVEALVNLSIIEVTAGSTTTCALTETGAMYLWGFGESVHPRDMTNIVDAPRLVKMRDRVKQIACGHSHVLILTDTGDVYTLGNGSMGQLGHGTRANVRLPRLVLKGKEIAQIAAGRYHSMAVTAYGVLYTWGCGESGQLAHNSLESELFPRIVDAILPNVVGQICCGEHHSFCLSSIEHASISQDVLNWKRIEDEEMSLKRSMLKDAPNGLKTRHVLQVESERTRIIQRVADNMRRDKEEEKRYLTEQLEQISGRDALMKDAQIHSAKLLGDANTAHSGSVPADLLRLTHGDDANAGSVSLLPSIYGSSNGAGGDYESKGAKSKRYGTSALSPSANHASHAHFSLQSPHGGGGKGSKQRSFRDTANPSANAGLTVDPLSSPTNMAGGDWERLSPASMMKRRSRMMAAASGVHTNLLGLDSSEPGAVGSNPSLGHSASEKGVGLGPRLLTPSMGSSSGRLQLAPVLGGNANGNAANSRSMVVLRPSTSPGVPAGVNGWTGGKNSNVDHTAVMVASTAGGAGEIALNIAPSNSTALVPFNDGPLAFHPLLPRLTFMEKTTTTLQKVKLQVQEGAMKPLQIISVDVFSSKKQYNILRAETKAKRRLLEQLRNTHLFMQPTEEDENRSAAHQVRIKELNMKLVTLNTRLMEAEENKKNYELYIMRMKEEDVQLSKQIDHLRHLVVEYDRLLAKMSKMNSRVSAQKTEIDDEIVRFRKDVADFAAFASSQISRYSNAIQHTISEAEFQERQAQEREERKSEDKRAKRVARLQTECNSATEEITRVREELSIWQENLAFYEHRFHKIMAATGLSKPEDIINKFFFNDEVAADLNRDLETKMQRRNEVLQLKEQEQHTLSQIQSDFVQSKWRDVDSLQSKAFEDGLKCTRLREDTDRVLQKLAFVKEGVVSLSGVLDDQYGPDKKLKKRETFADVCDAVVWWTMYLERRISSMAEAVHKGDKEKRRRAKAAALMAQQVQQQPMISMGVDTNKLGNSAASDAMRASATQLH